MVGTPITTASGPSSRLASPPVEGDELTRRFASALATCDQHVVFERRPVPADALRRLAEACESFGIDEWDHYAERGAVARLEQRVAELFDAPAAAFFPSGIMCQQAALRAWCDRSGSRRIALPGLSHLLHHELDGPRLLHRFEVELLTDGAHTPTVDHLTAIPGRLGAVLIELPLREAGCLLPTWEELTDFSVACRARRVPLHIDGARIWEAAAGYGRSLPELSRLADSMYVSFYKGLGGLAGSCLIGPDDLVQEARRWRTRHGGTLHRSTPEAIAALVGLRDVLPTIADSVAWARAFAAALPVELAVVPAPPATNTFLVYASGGADAINERILAIAEQEGVLLSAPWMPVDEPGRAKTEVTIGRGALDLDPVAMAERFAGTVMDA